MFYDSPCNIPRPRRSFIRGASVSPSLPREPRARFRVGSRSAPLVKQNAAFCNDGCLVSEPGVYSRGSSVLSHLGKRDASAVAADVSPVNREMKLTCRRACVEPPTRVAAVRLGTCLHLFLLFLFLFEKRECVEEERGCHGDGDRLRTPHARGTPIVNPLFPFCCPF